jgi:hypothetical protein
LTEDSKISYLKHKKLWRERVAIEQMPQLFTSFTRIEVKTASTKNLYLFMVAYLQTAKLDL